MNLTHPVAIDLLRPQKNVIHVVQGDNSRLVELALLAGNNPFDVSDGLASGETLNKYVEFRKPDGHGGTYDRTSLGAEAVSLKTGTTNVWIIAFDTQCFSVPGWTQINVKFETSAGRVLHTFALCADVEPSAGVNDGSGDWDNTGGFNSQVKAALLNLLDHVEYTDENKQAYLTELANAMYRPHGVTYITAAFDQGENKVYDTDELETLRQYLVVTAHYEDGTSETVLSYVLSGTLSVGTSVITVSYAEKTTTFNVTVSAVEIVSWSTGTDEQIAAMVNAMDAGALSIQDTGWQIGDERVVSLASMGEWSTGGYAHETHDAQSVTLVLMDSQHYDLVGGGKDHFVVGLKDALNEKGQGMSYPGSQGWSGSERRTWCNSIFRNAVPEALRNCFKQFYVVSAKSSSEITTTEDYFALFAEKEVIGLNSKSTQTEADALTQVAYYATSANRIKNVNGTASDWYTRSITGNGNYQVYIKTNGAPGETLYYNLTGIAPFGCI